MGITFYFLLHGQSLQPTSWEILSEISESPPLGHAPLVGCKGIAVGTAHYFQISMILGVGVIMFR